VPESSCRRARRVAAICRPRVAGAGRDQCRHLIALRVTRCRRLRWTTKSTRRLADELTRQGHRVSADTVADRLHEESFSLQGNTAAFAVESIRRWWTAASRDTYPAARTVDHRGRRWVERLPHHERNELIR
jgi:hypothetical protein